MIGKSTDHVALYSPDEINQIRNISARSTPAPCQSTLQAGWARVRNSGYLFSSTFQKCKTNRLLPNSFYPNPFRICDDFSVIFGWRIKLPTGLVFGRKHPVNIPMPRPWTSLYFKRHLVKRCKSVYYVVYFTVPSHALLRRMLHGELILLVCRWENTPNDCEERFWLIFLAMNSQSWKIFPN